jgi:hypothetical protein
MRHAGKQALADLVVRPPEAGEMERAVYLFRHGLLRPQSQIVVASRGQPVQRLVAAAAWWCEGSIARFHLVCQAGVTDSEVCGPLVHQVAASAHAAGMQKLQYADLLVKDDVWCQRLVENGFAQQGPNRFFEARCTEARDRVMRLFEKHQAALPPGWRTESIRNHPAQTAAELVARHGLLPPSELDLYWQGNFPGGFDPDASSFLLENTNRIGVLLTRASQDTYFVDVRIVQIENRQLRALGNLMLLHHLAARWDQNGPICRLQFHGGGMEHRETANLAFRMRGRELPTRHIYAKAL